MQILNRLFLGSFLGSMTSSLLVILIFPFSIISQPTVGLMKKDTSSYDGYTLFAGLRDSSAYLIDNYGREVHSWKSGEIPLGHSIYLLEDGELLWCPLVTEGGHFLKFDWDGNVVWEWEDLDPSYHQHHDVAPLPNGNVIILVRDIKTAAETFQAGRDPSLLLTDTVWSESIYEIEQTGPNSGNIVWEWNTWDHLVQDFDNTKDNFGVVADHPELMNINFGGTTTDWLHANAISYNAELDQVIISQRTISEFHVIDHSTTTAEAAGHTAGNNGKGGDIIYRWGSPITYQRGDSTDQTISRQHDTQWIGPGLPGAGNFLVFSNGNDWGYTSVVESVSPVLGDGTYPSLLPGEAHSPAASIWEYMDDPPESLFALFIGGCQRLPNGNTLICNGPAGEFREVNTDNEIVWQYVNPATRFGNHIQGVPVVGLTNAAFRCTRLAPDYPGLAGKDLTPTSPIEIYPVTISGTAHAPDAPTNTDSIIAITAAISADSGIVTTEVMVDTGTGYYSITMFDDGNHEDGLSGDGLFGGIFGNVSGGKIVSYYVEVVDGADSLVNDPPYPSIAVYDFQIGYNCGDMNGIPSASGLPDITDLTYLVSYLFKGGPAPPSLPAANVNGIINTGLYVDIQDLTYLVRYLFKGGSGPICQ